MRACFFGSFSPIHNGHLLIVKELIKKGYFVELIVSPHNPHKDESKLLPFDLRVELCEISLEHEIKLNIVNINTIENTLPKPNYTYKTLESLLEIYDKKDISIVGGSDVINGIGNWKKSDYIKTFSIIRMNRKIKGITQFSSDNTLNIIDTININFECSSTEVREMIKKGNETVLDKIPLSVYSRLIQYKRNEDIKKVLN